MSDIIHNYERKSFSVAAGSAEITDEMWDAIFGKKGKALEGPADVPQEDWDSKHEREESQATEEDPDRGSS